MVYRRASAAAVIAPRSEDGIAGELKSWRHTRRAVRLGVPPGKAVPSGSVFSR